MAHSPVLSGPNSPLHGTAAQKVFAAPSVRARLVSGIVRRRKARQMGGDVTSDTAVLAGGRGVWGAAPENYSSLRSLWLTDDGSGELIYGYGQTIYARINCRWEVVSAGRIRLTYLESPPFQRFRGYTPPDDQRVRELDYALTAGEVSGVESIVGRPYRFGWVLELSEPPWPPELSLPYEVPRVFYGHREPVRSQDAEPGAAPDRRT